MSLILCLATDACIFNKIKCLLSDICCYKSLYVLPCVLYNACCCIPTVYRNLTQSPGFDSYPRQLFFPVPPFVTSSFMSAIDNTAFQKVNKYIPVSSAATVQSSSLHYCFPAVSTYSLATADLEILYTHSGFATKY